MCLCIEHREHVYQTVSRNVINLCTFVNKLICNLLRHHCNAMHAQACHSALSTLSRRVMHLIVIIILQYCIA